jgi:hypothetical protein
LERKLLYEDILLYRKLTNADLNREKKKKEDSRAKGGFLNWLGFAAAPEEAKETKEQVLKELYAKIGYSPETVKYEFFFETF